MTFHDLAQNYPEKICIVTPSGQNAENGREKEWKLLCVTKNTKLVRKLVNYYKWLGINALSINTGNALHKGRLVQAPDLTAAFFRNYYNMDTEREGNTMNIKNKKSEEMTLRKLLEEVELCVPEEKKEAFRKYRREMMEIINRNINNGAVALIRDMFRGIYSNDASALRTALENVSQQETDLSELAKQRKIEYLMILNKVFENFVSDDAWRQMQAGLNKTEN